MMSIPVAVDLVIKLGGSAITEKSLPETFKEAAIRESVKLVKLCVNKGLKVVVVHGAGSFGHQQAKEYKVTGGWMRDSGGSQVNYGFSLTRVSCMKPCGNWTTQDGKVVQSGVSAVSSFLGAGFVPVLHGDCVLDTVTGCTILSGDTVIKTLCKELAVGKVVFLTDVAGIYDKPPQVPGAKLIPNIRVDENGKIVQQITTDALSCDVTGGIELKLSSAVEIVLQSKGTVPVFICQVGSKAAENICIGGEQLAVFEEGTVVTLCREN
ncbi:Isopentenyl phosphate kinase-like [Homarus americanus]|uniref:Isopentenyl phosphate kinase-like n=1 Tax=Homarus americanus TaxID=6706 RepID=A0A8J5NDB3_HOMAM|nr:Isopentenyl phosphate kinase-like [Homarus americanus]